MIKSGRSLIVWFAFPIAFVLATSGCASKKYVRQQVSPVHQQVAALQKQTNDKISYLNAKQDRDISQVNERIASTDQRVSQVAEAAQTAQGTASRAMDTAEANSGKIAETSTAVNELGAGVANALNYQLMERADVMFGFNEATLTPSAKKALDEIASKVQPTPRTVVELAGFTDPRGSRSFNYALSRRRAEAVQRYLVMQKVPVRNIHIVGLGKSTPPPDLEPENSLPANATRAQRYQADRRVQVRLFGAGNITTGTAGREQQ